MLKRSFFGGISSDFAGLDNYNTVVTNDAFRLAVKNTLLFDMISLPLLIMISLCMAYIVSNMNSKLIRFAFLAPMAIPSNSVVTVWKMLFDDAGIINGIRVMLKMEPVSFLTGQNSLYLLIGTYIWKNMGYDMLIWLTVLEAVPKDIYEAARVDGALQCPAGKYL